MFNNLFFTPRQFYGEFKSVEDLKDVPALPKTYYTRFMKVSSLVVLYCGKVVSLLTFIFGGKF